MGAILRVRDRCPETLEDAVTSLPPQRRAPIDPEVGVPDLIRRLLEAIPTLLGVAVLGYPHQLVEVEAVAVLPA